MIVSMIVCGLLGGLVFFAWSAISWSVLPWHHNCYDSFRNEEAVATFLGDQSPRSGIYGLPSPPRIEAGMSAEQRAQAERDTFARMKRGPIVTAVITKEGFGSLPRMLTVAYLTAVAAALILTWLVMQTTDLGYAGRVAFVAAGAMAGVIACRVADWNWHGYPTPFTLVALADQLIGWTLAGLLIAWLAPRMQ